MRDRLAGQAAHHRGSCMAAQPAKLAGLSVARRKRYGVKEVTCSTTAPYKSHKSALRSPSLRRADVSEASTYALRKSCQFAHRARGPSHASDAQVWPWLSGTVTSQAIPERGVMNKTPLMDELFLGD